MLTRSVIETDVYKYRRYGERRRRHWSLFEFLIEMFGILLKTTGMYGTGYRNATDIIINRLEFDFDDLPGVFHGYTILHLTDLHLDVIPGCENRICRAIDGLAYDACFLTGDYRAKISGGFKSIIEPFEKVVSAIRAKDGIYATLGNHDSYMMVHPMEKMGIRLLANETATITAKTSRIQVTGVDDPYYYYTDQAMAALEAPATGFKIALVHTPALFDAAADNGYRLYLCGHTHGGQICLPGGIPLVLHLRHGRRYYRGVWRYQRMIGYTSQGCGTAGIPIRFNTRSEITLITLNGRSKGKKLSPRIRPI
jgi:predicted MPP superfamily phosphohydrolase